MSVLNLFEQLPSYPQCECTIAILLPSVHVCVRNAPEVPGLTTPPPAQYCAFSHSLPKCQKRHSWDGRAMDVVGNAALAPACATRHTRSSLDACAGCFVCHRNCDWPAFPSPIRVHPPPMHVHTSRQTAYCVTTPLT